MADVAERIRLLEYWKNGNGTRGAETRLQLVEQKLDKVEDEYVKKTELEVMESNILEAILNRGKSAQEWLKTLAPYFALAGTLWIALGGSK